ncbi:hypothetical protein [Alteromonas sp. ASW11-130]|uniref:hypothetical protein n=1 Tax=Alteromonas sp. ASW11-130 TaxID=3015775 RepID=UPI0022423B83|nr:hypothetical protein [Alteromonas sp. ASW11-130]MCW8092968.1 hypothetical protein [Alteromonas sp. ASW11-130]
MNIIIASWVLKVIGASIAIISTIITGLIIASMERKKSELNKLLMSYEASLRKSESAHADSSFIGNFSIIQNLIVQNSNASSDSEKESYREALIHSLFAASMSSLGENGMLADRNKQAEIISAKESALKTDDKKELFSIWSEQTRLGGIYRGECIVKIAETNIKVETAEKKILELKNWAILLQVTGLVVLLMADIPSKEVAPSSATVTTDVRTLNGYTPNERFNEAHKFCTIPFSCKG